MKKRGAKNYSKYLKVAVKAAKAAGNIHLKYWKHHIKAIHKSRNELVTKADKLSEKKIISIIKRKFPTHSFLGEETGASGKSDYKWVIDPLDGTHNFFFGLPIFGTSIALTFKDKVIVGVIYFPLSKQLFYAVKGKGAYLNKKRIHVSNLRKINQILMTHGAAKQNRLKKIRSISRFYGKVFSLRLIGCATYSFTKLAEGVSSAYVIHTSKPWDVAAGSLIAQEAGAKITQVNGKPWNLYSKTLLVTNGKVHDKLLKMLRGV